MTDLLYLYGFLPEGAQSPPRDVTGIEGRAVDLLAVEGFAAAVSRVPEDEFGEAELAGHVSNLEWVARRGLVHERVVTWFVDHGGILPARLFTLYRSPEALLADAGSRAERIRGLLERFRDLQEWHLKVGRREGDTDSGLTAASARIRAADEAIATATPGRAYLLGRKREALAEEEASAAARRLAREAFEQVSGGAKRSRLIPIVKEAGEPPVILNAAFLVQRDRNEAFQAGLETAAERLRDHGLAVTFSGPWAPYRFIEDSEDGEGGAG